MSIDRVADRRRRFCTFKRPKRESVTKEGKVSAKEKNEREEKKTQRIKYTSEIEEEEARFAQYMICTS